MEEVYFNKIVFFNYYHSGDIHVSRSFIKFISEFGYPCEYWHKNDASLLSDTNVKYIPLKTNRFERNFSHGIVNGTLYINTWYNSALPYLDEYKLTFDCLYYYFVDVIKRYFKIDIAIYNPWMFFPEIDYSKFQIYNVDKFFTSVKNGKRIFISNGMVASGQSTNFDFNQIINKISVKYPKYLFFISNKSASIIKYDNIFFTKDIINIQGSDLNENSYISTKCDIIIGRHSGSYTYSITRDNYNRNTKYINFSIEIASWIYKLPLKYSADIIGYDIKTSEKALKMIEANI
jgi:hypothetical protein